MTATWVLQTLGANEKGMGGGGGVKRKKGVIFHTHNYRALSSTSDAKMGRRCDDLPEEILFCRSQSYKRNFVLKKHKSFLKLIEYALDHSFQ